jgi:hypothetical protein
MKPQSFSEPQSNWLPLKIALLIVAAPDQAARHEHLYQEISTPGNGEIHKSAEVSLSRSDLLQILRTQSGAKNVSVSANEPSLLYEYADGFRVEHKPWEVDSSEPVPISVPASAWLWQEVISGKRALDDQLAAKIKQYEEYEEQERTAARRERQASAATSFVWRELLLPCFYKAVAERRAIVWARRNSLSAEFNRIPSDVWSYVDPECIDWANSKVTVQDTTYWSAFVELSGEETFPTKSEHERQKRRTKGIQVAKVIRERWPRGLPEGWTNKEICRHVSNELKERQILQVSDDTILRAANRK